MKQKNTSSQKFSLFTFLNEWFRKKATALLITILFLSLFFGLLLFNVRISEGGDDSAYIESGYKYSKHFFGYYYTYNAPLYPMLLALPIWLFGIKLTLLKFISLVFSLLHIFCFYKAFRKIVPEIIFFPVLFIVGINSHFLYYASQTYNEVFFLFVQAIFFYSFFLLTEKLQKPGNNTWHPEIYWVFLGFTAFILSISKNISVMVLPAFLIYFLWNRQYKNAIYSIFSFVVFSKLFEIFKKHAWGSIAQYKGQLSVAFLKDAYHPEYGMEDMTGLLNRFWNNCNLYFSKRFLQILNMKTEGMIAGVNVYVTILVILLLCWGVFRIIRSQNKPLLFVSIYTGLMLGASFFLLQVQWDQPRLVLVFVPMMLLIIFYGIYDLLSKQAMILQMTYVLLFLAVISLSVSSTLEKTKKNLLVLQRNLKGDMYYGYTPDWKNYLEMSEWCGKNLPDSSFVACRKPSMSFIYSGGREFFPVYHAKYNDGDSVLTELKKNNVTHALVANLRKDKTKPADSLNVINTLHRYLKPAVEKYPKAFKLIHQIGKSEIAYLLEIHYPESAKKK